MPIAADMRHLYPANWPEIAHQVKTRAHWRCQHCRMRSNSRYYWRQRDGLRERVRLPPGVQPPGKAPVRVVQIGAAHLNHNPADNRPENLAALCRYCHLIHDIGFHQQRRAARIWRDMLARPLMVHTMEVA